MEGRWLRLPLAAAALVYGWSPTWADESRQFPGQASFSTLVTTPLGIEGLTGDHEGNLYTPARNTPQRNAEGLPCPVWRVNVAAPSALAVVGEIPAPCGPAGLAFNEAGDLFVAGGDRIYTFAPDDDPTDAVKPTVQVFASGLPGANGVAFDRDGNLWTGDGTTGQGRVWKIAPCRALPCPAELVFRIQPMRNGSSLGGQLAGDGVGRQARSFPPATSANSLGGQDLVANGLAFNPEGELFVADTARGAIWKVEFDRGGALRSQTGCDGTFDGKTLCLDSIFVAHPLLEGADGIALDQAGNIWVAANERNAVVVVARDGRVREVFRNEPDSMTNRRNTGPLEFPTSPFLLGRKFCTANSDGDRRDNSPNPAGDVAPAGPDRGKIACMDQALAIPGLPLPVR